MRTVVEDLYPTKALPYGLVVSECLTSRYDSVRWWKSNIIALA